MRGFCIACDEYRECITREERDYFERKGKRISYTRLDAICPVCGGEVYVPEVNDENVRRRNEKLLEVE